MELGLQKVYVDYLPTIAEALGVEVWEFFADPPETGACDETTKRLLEVWCQFDKAEKGTVWAVIEQICQKKELELQDPESNLEADCDCEEEKRGPAKRASTG